ncbi:MAG TPA: 2,3-bisphosphoglycerate-independent phosphoglycerate mutase [Candidatus Babeliales bacterium]|jgi:2,3-bisphosphoglycerate-independent phosphoglycerate mutase|nr:2,3-bisphosphoglycerate-independent phosphoglycerate mutase [Candidatus Babeliales bacterium]
MSIHPVALVILDGFGYSPPTSLKLRRTGEIKYNAIAQAKMPNFTQWWQHYPHAILKASGHAVGLPDHFIGNSEVGHLTIGAGRIIKQPMTIWMESIKNGSFAHNPVLLEGFKKLQTVGGTLHIIGLLSDAGVHAHVAEIYASIAAAVDAGLKKIVVHPILDGRDVAPRSAHEYLEDLTQFIKRCNQSGTKPRVIIGSLQGRFYAMDRGHNWDRVEKSYRMLTEKHEGSYVPWEKVLEQNYMHDVSDEFIPPTQLNPGGEIKNGDGILFCNVRPDRARELTAMFTCSSKPWRSRVKPINLTFFMTPVMYDTNLPTTVLFPRKPILHTLKDVLAEHHKTIFSVAETEKYAHVTYFFRGENEEPVATETRVIIPSIVAKNYIDHPEMSAELITEAVINSLKNEAKDFYLINYANADMVGHSGNFDATVKAVECLDVQLQKLYEQIVQNMNGTLYITADHGKAEQMWDEKLQQPRTAHTSNPVPFIMISKSSQNYSMTLPITELSQIAPFILQNMGIDISVEMIQISN